MKSLNVISLGIFLLCCSQHAYAIGPNRHEATPAQLAHQQAVINAAIYLNTIDLPSDIIRMTNDPNHIAEPIASRPREDNQSLLTSFLAIVARHLNQDQAEK